MVEDGRRKKESISPSGRGRSHYEYSFHSARLPRFKIEEGRRSRHPTVLRENHETALQRNLSKTSSRLIALNNLGNGGGLCLSAHSATKNSKSAVTT